MMLFREFPKSRFQFFLVRTSADAQHLVIIAFCHTDVAPEPEFGPTCSECADGTRNRILCRFLVVVFNFGEVRVYDVVLPVFLARRFGTTGIATACALLLALIGSFAELHRDLRQAVRL